MKFPALVLFQIEIQGRDIWFDLVEEQDEFQ
jgi:hypothetical protein